jgi:hypothetical protein
MTGAVNFCGASGASYRFERGGEDGDWRGVPGVVLFAAGDCSGWRVIDVADHAGASAAQSLDWRWRKARRYGASAVFVRRAAAAPVSRLEATDLALGLDPVFADTVSEGALAA